MEGISRNVHVLEYRISYMARADARFPYHTVPPTGARSKSNFIDYMKIQFLGFGIWQPWSDGRFFHGNRARGCMVRAIQKFCL